MRYRQIKYLRNLKYKIFKNSHAPEYLNRQDLRALPIKLSKSRSEIIQANYI
jgi:hypothetical protein